MSFYVTLPSNASSQIYPDNEPGHFLVKLPQTIDLSSQYEVGLVEIQFPSTYFNILAGEVWLEYTPAKENAENGKQPMIIMCPPGLYRSPEGFIDTLNKLLIGVEGDEKPQIRFHWNKAAKRGILKLFEKGAQVILSELLTHIFGFPTSHVSDANPVVEGEFEVNLEPEIKNVYVYCDLVAARHVGDVMVPLLRTVPILDRRSASVFRIYDKPHYVSLSRFSFDTMEMLLTTDMGKTIPFKSGTSVITLHFRTRKHFDLE